MNSERSGPIQEGVIRRGTLAATLAAVLLGLAAVTWLAARTLLPETLPGPRSPSSIEVELVVTDAASWNPGSDYYTDVRLTRREPHATFFWSDPSGQGSQEGVDALRSSMRWTSPDALEFDTADRKTVRISLSNGLWQLEESPHSKTGKSPARDDVALDPTRVFAWVLLGVTFTEDLARAERRAREFRRREGIANHEVPTAGSHRVRVDRVAAGILVTFSDPDPYVRDGAHHYLVRPDDTVERVSPGQVGALVDSHAPRS